MCFSTLFSGVCDGDKSAHWLGKKERGRKKKGRLKSRCAMCPACEHGVERERKRMGGERRGGERFKDTEDEMCDMR